MAPRMETIGLSAVKDCSEEENDDGVLPSSPNNRSLFTGLWSGVVPDEDDDAEELVCSDTEDLSSKPCHDAAGQGSSSVQPFVSTADDSKPKQAASPAHHSSPNKKQKKQMKKWFSRKKTTRKHDNDLHRNNATASSSIEATAEKEGKLLAPEDVNDTHITLKNDASDASGTTKKSKKPPVAKIEFCRRSSNFIRVSDLATDVSGLFGSLCSKNSSKIAPVTGNDDYDHEQQKLPNFDYASPDPPPGVAHSDAEAWVALDNGHGECSPLAVQTVQALARTSLSYVFDTKLWTPDSKTQKLISSKQSSSWHETTWETHGPYTIDTGVDVAKNHVYVWSGTLAVPYGGETPAIRSASILDMSPRALVDLLTDSSRVKEYNKLSLGRQDLQVWEESLDTSSSADGNKKKSQFGGMTKVMKSVTQPPLVRKPLEFVTLCHARPQQKFAIDGDSSTTVHTGSYEICSRAVQQESRIPISEILLGVNVIQAIKGKPDQCCLLTLNHLRSPMVPLYIAKKLGLAASYNFVQDLRKCVPK